MRSSKDDSTRLIYPFNHTNDFLDERVNPLRITDS